MGFVRSQTLNLLPRFFLLILLISPSISSSKPTAYEALENYNFPMGLLPKGVKDYTLDESTGWSRPGTFTMTAFGKLASLWICFLQNDHLELNIRKFQYRFVDHLLVVN
ncbi:Protein of unknown function DUF538 [Dillenia turbinata]|uniref:Uncharacterized protein n=1 Tax=Dillenia turbinata TaxID=194707 RepID=A0AAN8UF52_9MAGN